MGSAQPIRGSWARMVKKIQIRIKSLRILVLHLQLIKVQNAFPNYQRLKIQENRDDQNLMI